MPEDELKDFYVNKVLKGDIPYYEWRLYSIKFSYVCSRS
jgi:hypothetical protein